MAIAPFIIKCAYLFIQLCRGMWEFLLFVPYLMVAKYFRTAVQAFASNKTLYVVTLVACFAVICIENNWTVTQVLSNLIVITSVNMTPQHLSWTVHQGKLFSIRTTLVELRSAKVLDISGRLMSWVYYPSMLIIIRTLDTGWPNVVIIPFFYSTSANTQNDGLTKLQLYPLHRLHTF